MFWNIFLTIQKLCKSFIGFLKPNGWGIFQIPQDLTRETTFEDNDSIKDKKERTKIFGQYDHVSACTVWIILINSEV